MKYMKRILITGFIIAFFLLGQCTLSSQNKPEGAINTVVMQHVEGETPTLIVYGTHNPDPTGTKADKETAYRIQELIENQIGSEIRVKADSDVNATDIQTCNLMLYGGPVSNEIMAEINDDLPIQFENITGQWYIVAGEQKFTGEDVGVIMACPNPLNRERYVLIYAGISRIGTQNANKVYHGPTDYVIFNRASWKERTRQSPGPVPKEGFFDKSNPSHWKMQKKEKEQ